MSERGILKYDYVNKLLASEKLNINMLASRNHQLVDFDASAFIPYFIQKLGDPKDPIRKGFKQIVKQISPVYPPAKVFNYLISGLA
jgi:cytoskeleton-associated protein 5